MINLALDIDQQRDVINAVINFPTPFKAIKNYKMKDYQLLKNKLAPQSYLLKHT